MEKVFENLRANFIITITIKLCFAMFFIRFVLSNNYACKKKLINVRLPKKIITFFFSGNTVDKNISNLMIEKLHKNNLDTISQILGGCLLA